MVSGAKTEGGFVAASASLWNEVSTIHATGSEEQNGQRPRDERPDGPPSVRVLVSSIRLRRRRAGATRRDRPAGRSGDVRVNGRAHRPASSRKSDEMVRSAKVAMMIVPITTTTPAAAASPYSYLRNIVR